MPRGLRLRVFAGPNGSGKTTIIQEVRKARVNDRPIDFGLYINADDLARNLTTGVDLKEYEIASSEEEFWEFAVRSGLLGASFDLDALKRSFVWKDGSVRGKRGYPRDRLAQLLAQFFYDVLLKERSKFSFETVFSHRGKLDLMKRAAHAGYKVYLYFISTEDPAINVERVKKIRVKEGGHDVPEEKIINRYGRTMELLDDALSLSYHAYLWDNSETGAGSVLFCEMKRGEEGVTWKIEVDRVPLWFMEHVLMKHPDDPVLAKIMDDASSAYRRKLALE